MPAFLSALAASLAFLLRPQRMTAAPRGSRGGGGLLRRRGRTARRTRQRATFHFDARSRSGVSDRNEFVRSAAASASRTHRLGRAVQAADGAPLRARERAGRDGGHVRGKTETRGVRRRRARNELSAPPTFSSRLDTTRRVRTGRDESREREQRSEALVTFFTLSSVSTFDRVTFQLTDELFSGRTRGSRRVNSQYSHFPGHKRPRRLRGASRRHRAMASALS